MTIGPDILIVVGGSDGCVLVAMLLVDPGQRVRLPKAGANFAP